MHVLNERCEGEISPGITFIDIDSAVSDIYGRLAPLKTGMKIIRISKSAASWTKLSRRIDRERVLMGGNRIIIVISPYNCWCCNPNYFVSCLCEIILYQLSLQITPLGGETDNEFERYWWLVEWKDLQGFETDQRQSGRFSRKKLSSKFELWNFETPQFI